ncbi:J domain-containing protein [Anthocerotibacter panamensis]|uniref:J domain-containing protein n=1 Tax=Anthocerotibacter panamensis TaxID=2857077 RepID=UPI001C404A48|nr:J domain-containing protein [Anthocerotibacter panamensis]
MGTITDYYACLGLPLTATSEDVRNAYRQVARRVHPDRFVSNEEDRQFAVSLFTEWVAPAYRVLSTDTVRLQFDRKYRDTVGSQVSLGLPRHFLIERLQNATSPGVLRQIYEQEVQNIFATLYTDLQQATAQVELLSVLNRAYIVIQLIAPWQKRATPALRPVGDRYITHARQLLEQNKIADAFSYLRASESQITDRAEYHYLLGLCYLRRGTPTVARTEFLTAQQYNPQHAGISTELKHLLLDRTDASSKWWQPILGALKRMVNGTAVRDLAVTRSNRS